MDKKIKNRIKNIAADILVSPLTAIAASKEMAKMINESENGQKIREDLKKKSQEVSDAVRSVADNDKSEAFRNSVKDVAGKISGVFTGGIGKVNDFLHDVENKTVFDQTADNTDNIEECGENFQAEDQKSAAGISPETAEEGGSQRTVSGECGDVSVSETEENSENSNCSE